MSWSINILRASCSVAVMVIYFFIRNIVLAIKSPFFKDTKEPVHGVKANQKMAVSVR